MGSTTMWLKIAFAAMLIISIQQCTPKETPPVDDLASKLEYSLKEELLKPWYPKAIDSVDGGFLSSFTFDFQPTEDQRKMIVSQARHTWTNSKAAIRYPDVKHFGRGATHGYHFLRDVMWDKTYGGFYWLVEKNGTVVKSDSLKTAYGNAFGIYALAAYYEYSHDTAALELGKKAFTWLEEHSHDHEYKGYFQHLTREGVPVFRDKKTPSTAELGYKDQNSSIHLLEAFTELYMVWPDPLLRERLREMLFLIRDTIVTDTGYLTLFLERDWKPVSFREEPREVIEQHHSLDHVSFGHDVETAYLLMEASHVLGIENDTTTLTVAKKMVDHALVNGWDQKGNLGSFFDEGYYFKDEPKITITHRTKNWWAQGEGLNTLLIMADLYPTDPMNYHDRFMDAWRYIDTNLVDHQYGDWYAGGLDEQPEMKTALKGHIWKATYHQYRSLANCIDRLRRSNP